MVDYMENYLCTDTTLECYESTYYINQWVSLWVAQEEGEGNADDFSFSCAFKMS